MNEKEWIEEVKEVKEVKEQLEADEICKELNLSIYDMIQETADCVKNNSGNYLPPLQHYILPKRRLFTQPAALCFSY